MEAFDASSISPVMLPEVWANSAMDEEKSRTESPTMLRNIHAPLQIFTIQQIAAFRKLFDKRDGADLAGEMRT